LDLHDKQIDDRGASELLNAPVLDELRRLDLRTNPIGARLRRVLQLRFGDRVIL
jgi:hypothetical protein